jgi:hypothetical protein
MEISSKGQRLISFFSVAIIHRNDGEGHDFTHTCQYIFGKRLSYLLIKNRVIFFQGFINL